MFARLIGCVHASSMGNDRSYRGGVRGRARVACNSCSSSSFRHLTAPNWSSTGTLPQNASIAETNAQIARFEREQLEGNDGSIIGRPTWELAHRGSFSRSICRPPTAGLAKWSS